MSPRWYTENPLKRCGEQYSNTTIAFHDCLCKFSYSSHNQKNAKSILKYKHCSIADDLRKQVTLDAYKIGGISIFVLLILLIAIYCIYKGYEQTKQSPCDGCLHCFKKKKKKRTEDNGNFNGVYPPAGNDYHAGFDETWVSDMNVNRSTDHEIRGHRRRRGNPCMRFCLSEPVQDCCEFFDCDLMWRRKNIYSTPYFGKRKNQPSSSHSGDSEGGELNNAYNLQNMNNLPAIMPVDMQHLSTMERRPTRPAPPPPQLPGAPGSAMYHVPVFEDGTPITDEIECEPVPEAPPSPEPERRKQPDAPRSIYVDPLSFLQKPFLRLSIALAGKDRTDSKEEEEPEPLYSKVKDFVMSRVRKTGSVVSLNKAGGVSNHPDGGDHPVKMRNAKTASLASLHNIDESQNYDSNRRSASMASLSGIGNGQMSRHGSRYHIADEDIPPQHRDEYIDLEEMARKMAARMNSTQSGNSVPEVVTSQPMPRQQMSGGKVVEASARSDDRTPDFIPASAYGTKQPDAHQPQNSQFEIGPSSVYPNGGENRATPPASNGFIHPNFSSFTPMSTQSPSTASSGPASPVTSVGVNGTVVPYMPTSLASTHSTPGNTLGKTKPAVPPRPAVINDNPNYKSMNRNTMTPPSPRTFEGRRPVATVVGSPSTPILGASRPTMAPPMPPQLSLQEQQLLQQQLFQQQYYQPPIMNPAAAMQQLLLQQQMQSDHILTPAVQQQMLAEQQQQIYQHMMQQQQLHLQQQLLQQQYAGMGGVRYRQPLSSTSSNASTLSSRSSRSTLTKPNHAPPPPPMKGGNGNSSIESSI